MNFQEYNHLNNNIKQETKKKRWYDGTFVKVFIISLEKAPQYKQDHIAIKINKAIEDLLKQEINSKVNSNKYMVLGRYKEFEKRRWYDRNANVLKAVKNMQTLTNQNKELQKKAAEAIIGALGTFYINNIDKNNSENIITEKQEVKIAENNYHSIPETTSNKEKKSSNIVISGEKLFIKKDKTPKRKLTL